MLDQRAAGRAIRHRASHAPSPRSGRASFPRTDAAGRCPDWRQVATCRKHDEAAVWTVRTGRASCGMRCVQAGRPGQRACTVVIEVAALRGRLRRAPPQWCDLRCQGRRSAAARLARPSKEQAEGVAGGRMCHGVLRSRDVLAPRFVRAASARRRPVRCEVTRLPSAAGSAPAAAPPNRFDRVVPAAGAILAAAESRGRSRRADRVSLRQVRHAARRGPPDNLDGAFGPVST